jgi:hypothetical protein
VNSATLNAEHAEWADKRGNVFQEITSALFSAKFRMFRVSK